MSELSINEHRPAWAQLGISPANILHAAEVVADLHGYDVEELLDSRAIHPVRIRQAFYWACHELLRCSFPLIGRALGKDHTSVLAGTRRFATLVAREPALAEVAQRIAEVVIGQPPLTRPVPVRSGPVRRSLAQVAQDCWQVAEDHGFHGPVPPHGRQRTFGDACSLLHTEVSEAFEAWRADGTIDVATGPDGRLEGPAAELADVVIRAFDTAIYDCGLTAEAFAALIEAKIAYNRGRPFKHGKCL
jgi:NTP pyrophosphatase (non-canonical NTP hydrolase)